MAVMRVTIVMRTAVMVRTVVGVVGVLLAR